MRDWIYFCLFLQVLFYFNGCCCNEEDEECHLDFSTLKNNVDEYEKEIENISAQYKIEENKNILYYKYRLLSCILGAFYGDAIGAYLEFFQRNNNNYNRIFKGSNKFGYSYLATDDSEMAMSMAYSIMSNPDINNINFAYNCYFYRQWYEHVPFDWGKTTEAALGCVPDRTIENIKKNEKQIKEEIAKKTKNSLSNGFLMRLSPFICWCFFKYKVYDLKTEDDIIALYDKIEKQVKEDVHCTHSKGETFKIATAFTIIGLLSIKGHFDVGKNNCEILKKIFYDKDGTLKKHFQNTKPEFNLLFNKNIDSNKIKEEIAAFGKGIDREGQGFYVYAFSLVLFYLLFWEEYKDSDKYKKYRNIMNEICNFGGDTDTNCAIVGTIIGPIIGYDNFDKKEDFYEFLLKTNISSGVNLQDENEENNERSIKYRTIYSPYYMIDYIDFLYEQKENFKEDVEDIKNKENVILIENVNENNDDENQLLNNNKYLNFYKKLISKNLPKAWIVITGAMNPPHKGHITDLKLTCNKLISQGFFVEKIIISPSSTHYLKYKKLCAQKKNDNNFFVIDFDTRKKMCEVCAKELKKDLKNNFVDVNANVEVTDFEETESNKINQWIDFPEVVKHFQKEAGKDITVFYVCGSDHYDNVNNLDNVVIIKRKKNNKYDTVNLKNNKNQLTMNQEEDFSEISSTKIREKINDDKFLEKYLYKDVLNLCKQTFEKK